MQYEVTDRLLRPEQVAEITGQKVKTVRSYIERGKFRKVKVGRSVRVPEDWLKKFIADNTILEKGTDQNKK